VTEGPDGVAGRRTRLPGSGSPAAGELSSQELSPRELIPQELAAGAPGLLLGGRLDLTEITGLTLAAIVPAFAEGAGVFVLEHLLAGRRAAEALRAGGRGAVPAGRGPRHRRRLVRHHPAGRRPDRPRRR
jgi:hypothetical protein